MGKIITFYNHKGGVGKTTLVHNLAFALADLGHRVLLIDADPQMNLTSAIYGLSTSTEYSSEESSKWNQYIQQYISITEHLDHYLKNDPPQKRRFQATSKDGVIHLISGSIMLSSTEASLYGIVKSRNEFTRDIPYKFERSIRDNIKDYDFILIDTSPSASSIVNALIAMSCDYIITPVSPTFFSLQAIDNLSEVIRNWIELLHDYQATQGVKGLSFSPKFLGLVVQLAKRFSGGAVRTGFSSSTEDWIFEVNQSVRRFLNFAKVRGITVTEDEFKKIFPESNPYVIEKCCDFTPKLRDVAEKEGIPVIYLTPEICKKHKITNIENEKSQYRLALKSINDSYRGIAKSLEALL